MLGCLSLALTSRIVLTVRRLQQDEMSLALLPPSRYSCFRSPPLLLLTVSLAVRCSSRIQRPSLVCSSAHRAMEWPRYLLLTHQQDAHLRSVFLQSHSEQAIILAFSPTLSDASECMLVWELPPLWPYSSIDVFRLSTTHPTLFPYRRYILLPLCLCTFFPTPLPPTIFLWERQVRSCPKQCSSTATRSTSISFGWQIEPPMCPSV